jgi:zinc protease
MAERSFGGIAPGPAVPGVVIKEPPQRGERSVKVHKDVQLPGIVIAYRAPEALHPDAPALNVIEYILFRGRSSRLYRRLIYEEPLATDLSGGFHIRRDPSTFIIRATARPGVEIERVRAAIIEAYESLRISPPTEAEIGKAMKQITADFVFGQEHNFELGEALGAEECRASWEEHFRFQDACLAVTSGNVVDVAARTFVEQARTVGYLVPEGGSR